MSGSAYIAVNFWDVSGAHLGTYASSTLSGIDPDWTKLDVSAAAPGGTAYVRVEFRLTGPGTLWADDVVLTA